MKEVELQQLVEQVSLESFGIPFLHNATFNSRLRTTGGRYHMTTHDLDFNQKVLDGFGKEIFLGVIKHELCHYHLHLAGRGYQHKNPDFKKLLKKVGGLKFTPSLKEKQKSIKLWQYQCLNCREIVQRERRFNTQKYICSKCSGTFQLFDQIVIKQ